jgi:hypothetical protein
MSPQSPCLGQPALLVGTKFIGAKRVTAWLKGDTPERATIVDGYTLDRVPYAVKLGEASVDARGGFELSYTLQATMGPVSTGGQLLVEPGKDYTVVLVDDGQGGGTRGLGFRVGPCDGATPSPVSRASLRIEPAFPCYGETVTAIGDGFQGPSQRLTFHLAATRFGDGPSEDVEVPVASDGTLHYAFRLDDRPALMGPPQAQAGTRYFLEAFDTRTNTKLSVPVPICNAPLEQALKAPSIPISGGMQGRIDLSPNAVVTEAPPTEDESAVIRSKADLDAFGARHHMTPEVLALLPAFDFTRQVGLMVLSGQRLGSESLEIVGVESQPDGLNVHAVAWVAPSPLLGPSVWFHYVPIPKTDAPIRFTPPVSGLLDQRAALAPDLTARHYPNLSGSLTQPPSVRTD